MLFASVLGVGLNALPAIVSAAQDLAVTTIAIDPVTCHAINSAIKASSSLQTSAVQAAIPKLTDDDCRAVYDWGLTGLTALGVATASAATTCAGFWKSFHLYSGPIETATDHLNIGLCWNGTTVWRDWGPDCYVTTIPGLTGAVSWCGYLNNNTALINPGDNFSVATLVPPITKYGWYRLYFNKNGVLTQETGSCCS